MRIVQVMVIVLAALITAVLLFRPGPYPVKAANFANLASFTLVTASAVLHFPLYPTSMPVAWVAATLLIIAVAPPLAGFIESRRTMRGDAIGFLGPRRGPGGRFWPHLATNLLGAVTATMLVWATQQIPGIADYASQGDGAAMLVNVLVPLVLAVMFAFARTQQLEREPGIDERVRKRRPWPDASLGFSLGTWNQGLNLLHLVAATYLSASGVLVLFGLVISDAKAGAPVEFSLWTGVAMVAGVCFLLACGLPGASSERTVYLTFATGTPVALGASLLILTLMADTRARDLFALGLLIIGYAAYSVLVLRHESQRPSSRGRRSAPTGSKALLANVPHYFASTLVALVLLIEVLLLYTTN